MLRERLSIVSVGDIVIRENLFNGERPISSGFAQISALIKSADISFGDLEMPFSTRGFPCEKLVNFRANSIYANDLKKTGFNILSLANNHSMDYGYEALFDTMDVLDNLGIRHLGAGKNYSEATAPLILEVKGWRIGFLAFSCLLPVGSAASENRPGVAPIYIRTAYEIDAYGEMEEPGNPPVVRTSVNEKDLKYVESSVKKLKESVDLLIVSIHWGFGSGDNLAEYQQPLGHLLIDNGADLILGHHVHSIHGIEKYKSKIILYSPGNFIAQQPGEELSEKALAIIQEMSPHGYMAMVDLALDGTYKINIYPTSTNLLGVPEFVPRDLFFSIANRIKNLSERLNTEVEISQENFSIVVF